VPKVRGALSLVRIVEWLL
jgi:hypothetical protein